MANRAEADLSYDIESIEKEFGNSGFMVQNGSFYHFDIDKIGSKYRTQKITDNFVIPKKFFDIRKLDHSLYHAHDGSDEYSFHWFVKDHNKRNSHYMFCVRREGTVDESFDLTIDLTKSYRFHLSWVGFNKSVEHQNISLFKIGDGILQKYPIVYRYDDVEEFYNLTKLLEYVKLRHMNTDKG